MRALVGIVVASSVLAATPAVALARKASDDKHHKLADKRGKKLTASRAPQGDSKSTKTRAARITATRGRERIEPRELAHGQSVGVPWSGRLQHASQLPSGDGYVIRHPSRAFGTETTVAMIERAVGETIEAFPDQHALAIGDISTESGGRISDHRSHQAGRDVDIGLFYSEQPQGYPESFVHATRDNLDCAATLKLIQSFYATRNDDGGVQMIFLDYDVQGILYNWAVDHGFSEDRLDRIFQYGHGRGGSDALVRHWPNHDNHIHVRFKCPDADSSCHD
ncbi:MAG TPA: penicillin-insensitive murein endopeptidase [Kofleriaceae bacterium]